MNKNKFKTLWRVFWGNKQTAQTLGEFIVHGIDHIQNGGNYATSELSLSDDTIVTVTIERVPTKTNQQKLICWRCGKNRYKEACSDYIDCPMIGWTHKTII